jgi:hypothetical protein
LHQLLKKGEKIMTGLLEKRRWINISKVDQAFFNSKQGAYQTVPPGSFVEGAHVEAGVKNCPWFRETTAHLVQKELYVLVQEETDIELLKHLAVVEQYTGRRDSCIKIFDNRVKVLSEAKPNGNPVNTAHA